MNTEYTTAEVEQKASELGMSISTVKRRVKNGESLTEILKTPWNPHQNRVEVTIRGVTKTLARWALETNHNYTSFHRSVRTRITQRGMTETSAVVDIIVEDYIKNGRQNTPDELLRPIVLLKQKLYGWDELKKDVLNNSAYDDNTNQVSIYETSMNLSKWAICLKKSTASFHNSIRNREQAGMSRHEAVADLVVKQFKSIVDGDSSRDTLPPDLYCKLKKLKSNFYDWSDIKNDLTKQVKPRKHREKLNEELLDVDFDALPSYLEDTMYDG